MKVRDAGTKISTYRNTECAPTLFFDAPVAWPGGAIIAVELGFRAMSPGGQGEGEGLAETECHIAGRLRCSPAAARLLRNALDKALNMSDRRQDDEAPALVG